MLAGGIPLVASNVHGILDYMKDASIVKLYFPRDFLLHQNKTKNTINLGKVVHLR